MLNSNNGIIDAAQIDNYIRESDMKFAETRSIIEREVNQFYASLDKLDVDIKQQIGFNPECNARNMLPALWIEPFDEEVYKAQLTTYMNYVQKVKAVLDGLNREAIACLQSSQSAPLNSAGV